MPTRDIDIDIDDNNTETANESEEGLNSSDSEWNMLDDTEWVNEDRSENSRSSYTERT